MKTFFLFLFFIYLPLSFAGETDKNLHQVQGKIKKISSQLSQLKQQEKRASKKLKHIERKYGRIAHTLQTLTRKTKVLQQRISKIQREIRLQNTRLNTQKQGLAKQVKVTYILGKKAPLKLLLSQEDIARSSRILHYYEYYNRQRIEHIQQTNNSLLLLQGLQAEKHQAIKALTPLITDKKQQQQQLLKTKRARKKLLNSLKKDTRSQRDKLSRLKKNAQQLKKVIRNLQAVKATERKKKQAQAFHRLKGKLSWPVKGKMLQAFGSRQAEAMGNGVLIEAKEGVSVKAIASGKIVFSQWMKGYGLLIIVQHDKDYMSLYAFNQSLYKTKGDWVNKGDTLATLGRSGGRNIPALYFEIRKKGIAVNPAKWCR